MTVKLNLTYIDAEDLEKGGELGAANATEPNKTEENATPSDVVIEVKSEKTEPQSEDTKNKQSKKYDRRQVRSGRVSFSHSVKMASRGCNSQDILENANAFPGQDVTALTGLQRSLSLFAPETSWLPHFRGNLGRQPCT